ncbi:protein regulator of cytokinesis 1-like [Sinocyclocheilus rhinocerous]|uniref:protein regulator of cytokinesis 1-like n=1 Tax=Sinocyclocheilus rhinocerous TaxID=307959 RepID=UPI0007BA21D5|nr:PREDICTED: protein regulator of cytokinesis 1-like [Sinocyclocheilus rhinocerous]
MRKSELIAAESVACLNKALCHLKDIWEEIGIPEDQRLERTNVVKNHVKSLLDMMIAEEESLWKRLTTSIETCQNELSKLCLELQLPPFQEDRSSTMLQQEKDLRIHLEVMLKEKNQRMQALKTLTEQDQDLCDLLCFQSFSVSADSVPSLEQLEKFCQHISSLTAEKLEKKLKAEIEQWEHEQNGEFQVNGQKFMQFVTDQWETYRLEKEREKQERQLKKSKQTEEDMVYGTVIRTPTKQRFLGSTTPCKARKLNATSSTGTSNSTIRSVFGGTVCHSPISRPPILESKGNVKTPGHSKPPHQGLLECNKENICHLTGGVAGMTKVTASPQRNFSINSVASTYSEFQRDLSKSSKSKHVPEILNSTIIQL